MWGRCIWRVVSTHALSLLSSYAFLFHALLDFVHSPLLWPVPLPRLQYFRNNHSFSHLVLFTSHYISQPPQPLFLDIYLTSWLANAFLAALVRKCRLARCKCFVKPAAGRWQADWPVWRLGGHADSNSTYRRCIAPTTDSHFNAAVYGNSTQRLLLSADSTGRRCIVSCVLLLLPRFGAIACGFAQNKSSEVYRGFWIMARVDVGVGRVFNMPLPRSLVGNASRSRSSVAPALHRRS